MADLDFLMGATTEPATEPTEKSAPSGEDVVARAAENQKAMEAIVDVLSPSTESSAEPAPEKKTGETDDKKPDATPVAQPVMHDPKLIHLASVHGIGPDEAAAYPNARELLKEIHYRELQYRRANPDGAAEPPPKEKADELPLPDIKLDDDVDPTIKAAVTSLTGYAKQLKTWADARIAAQETIIESLRAGQEQAAFAENRTREAKIAQLFDEKAASWGPEFKELIGTPTETWRKPGTKEHAELVRLKTKTWQLANGFVALEGRDPTVDELGGFMDEAHYALWPDRIKTVVRNEISSGAKKQRGGVGLRPGKGRNESPPEQGDDAAKDAIGSFMADHGLDPWARRQAV